MANTATTGTSAAASELSLFAPELTNNNGQITTTSLQVAQHFNRGHNIVMRSIRNLDCSAEFRRCNFAQSSYLNEQGKKQPMFHITKDGFMFLAMGFTGKEAAQWKEAYIAEFNRREAEINRVFLDSVQPDLERIAYSVGATDTLSAAQAEQLRLIFKNKCATLPDGEQADFMTKGWSKLKSHFGVTYRKIEQREFHEALSLATRHAAEWTNSKALKPPVSMAALPAPEPVTAATLVSLLMGDCLSERAVLDIALAASVTLLKKAVSKPNGFGNQVARKIDRHLPQADLHAILVAASMEMNMRVVGAKMELEKVE